MAGFFNTSWNIGNAFNSPFSMDQGELTNQESFLPMEKDARGLVERPGGYGPTGTPTWGAPTGYDPSQQQSNIFNPYQTGANSYYNPYSFGQNTYGTQYGGSQEMPWWMNYNQNNSVPNIPTTSFNTMDQGKYVGNPNHSGTGPNGKDLTYDETIKYFGLYDGAENAFAAGDKQAAYRQDHMQWRTGTGAWEGNGKQEGQSDLDYPGRTTDAGDVIMGDRQKLLGLSGMFGEIPDNLKALFSGSQDNEILNATPAIGGGSGFTQVPMTAGPFDYLQRGRNKYTASDVQAALDAGLLDPDRVGVEYTNSIDPMLKPGNTTQANLPRGFFPEAPNDKQLAAIQRSLLNQVYTVKDYSNSFIESDIPPYDPYQNNQGSDRFGPAPTTQYDAGPAEMTIAEVNALAASDGQARYERGLAETAAATKAAQEQAALQEQANIFLQNSLAEQKAREAAAKVAADKAAQDRQDEARKQNNKYETGPVTPNIFISEPQTISSPGASYNGYSNVYGQRFGL